MFFIQSPIEREDRVTWLTNVANGVVDVTAAQVTQNLVRDGKAGVDFISPYLYTGQGFLVRKDSGILNLATLNGHEVGLFSGTTAEQNLQDAMKEYGGTFIPVYYDNLDEMLAGYAQGDIDAIINDLPLLGGLIDTFSNPDEHLLLDDVISKEPLSMVVDENQSDWKDAVSWVQYGLLQAEEYGITQDNIDQILADNTDSNPDNDSDISTRIFLGIEGNAGELLGLENDYMVNVIKAVGNYGEIYERHFDSDILPRDFNQLSGDFGLQIPYPQGITVNPTNDVSINNEPPVFGSLGNETLDAGIDPGFDGTDDIVFGGSGNDLIDTVAGTGGNRVYGQSGNDTLTLGGNDRAFGGTGDDRFFLLGGDNIVTGGAGADQFWIANAEIPESPHTVTDFDLEDDLLNIAGLGVGSFNELTLSNEDGNALIAFEENKLAQLIGVNADSLSADHFGLIQ